MAYKQRQCISCSKLFQPASGAQKYCTNCKTSICPICEKTFVHAGPSEQRKYCSHNCYLASRWGTSHQEQVRCANCGETFRAYASAYRKYCSPECATQAKIGTTSSKKKGKYIRCEWCSKRVYRYPYEIEQKQHLFCSPECSAMWWAEYGLHGSDHPAWKGGYCKRAYSNGWKEARRAVIIRSHGKCEVCGCIPERYEVHHIKPVILCSTPEEANQIANLIGTCTECHRKEEQLSQWAFGLDT